MALLDGRRADRLALPTRVPAEGPETCCRPLTCGYASGPPPSWYSGGRGSNVSPVAASGTASWPEGQLEEGPRGTTTEQDAGRFDWPAERPVSFCRLPRDQEPLPRRPARVRLILENSTVCLIVDELVCYAPLTIMVSGAFGCWMVVVVAVSLTMILTTVSFVLSGEWLSFSSHWLWLVWGFVFRWRV